MFRAGDSQIGRKEALDVIASKIIAFNEELTQTTVDDSVVLTSIRKYQHLFCLNYDCDLSDDSYAKSIIFELKDVLKTVNSEDIARIACQKKLHISLFHAIQRLDKSSDSQEVRDEALLGLWSIFVNITADDQYAIQVLADIPSLDYAFHTCSKRKNLAILENGFHLLANLIFDSRLRISVPRPVMDCAYESLLTSGQNCRGAMQFLISVRESVGFVDNNEVMKLLHCTIFALTTASDVKAKSLAFSMLSLLMFKEDNNESLFIEITKNLCFEQLYDFLLHEDKELFQKAIDFFTEYYRNCFFEQETGNRIEHVSLVCSSFPSYIITLLRSNDEDRVQEVLLFLDKLLYSRYLFYEVKEIFIEYEILPLIVSILKCGSPAISVYACDLMMHFISVCMDKGDAGLFRSWYVKYGACFFTCLISQDLLYLDDSNQNNYELLGAMLKDLLGHLKTLAKFTRFQGDTSDPKTISIDEFLEIMNDNMFKKQMDMLNEHFMDTPPNQWDLDKENCYDNLQELASFILKTNEKVTKLRSMVLSEILEILQM